MPNLLSRSLFEAIPADLPEERFDDWLQAPGLRLERILSRGHVTPEGEWYDQVQDEWVAVLQGAATLMIEGQEEPLELRPGDSVLLPAHCRHRVAWTAPDQVTIWLALHFLPASG